MLRLSSLFPFSGSPLFPSMSICANLERVNETSSSEYPTLLFSMGLVFCFDVTAFSAKAAFTNAS